MLLFVQFLKILDTLGNLVVDVGVIGFAAGGKDHNGDADDREENADQRVGSASAAAENNPVEQAENGYDQTDDGPDVEGRRGKILEISLCFHNKSPLS